MPEVIPARIGAGCPDVSCSQQTLRTKSVPPTVSVAIVTYNQKTYLREAINSVIAQDYPNFEIVVADDGSTDGTAELLRQFDRDHPGLFRLVLAEKNAGITANCNRALDACTGEYISWLGGDDMMLPGRISKQVAILEADPTLSACISAADVFDSSTGASLFVKSAQIRGKREYGCVDYIRSGNCVLGSAATVRRSMCPVNGHDWRVPVISDFLFFIELSRNGNFFIQDDVLTRYRKHAGQVTAGGTLEHPDLWMTLQIVEFQYPEMMPHTHKVRADYLFSRGAILINRGRPVESRLFLRNSFLYSWRLFTLAGLCFSYLPVRFQRWALDRRDERRAAVMRSG